MIVVLDTNIFISALLNPPGCPGRIVQAWLDDEFVVPTCEKQLEEIRDTSRKTKFVRRFPPHKVGRMLTLLRESVFINIPRRHTALDPTDSFLLDLAAAASADYLVTGDKRSGLLQQGRIGSTRILTPSDFCTSVLKLKL